MAPAGTRATPRTLAVALPRRRGRAAGSAPTTDDDTTGRDLAEALAAAGLERLVSPVVLVTVAEILTYLFQADDPERGGNP